jgi:anti-sigma factor RsiW
MSAGLEHDQFAESLGAYALGALPEAESERLRLHLAGCRECVAELDRLRAAVDALPASVLPIEPPGELKARLMEIVESEAALLRAAGEAADRPPPTHPPRRHRWLAGRAVRPGLALAAACLAAIAIILLTSGGGGGTRTIQARITGPALAGRVRASLRVHGSRAELFVSGLPAPAAGHVEELWVQRPGAAPNPAGTFVLRSGSVQVARAVHRGDRVLVTVEPGRGSRAPTTAPFILVSV